MKVIESDKVAPLFRLLLMNNKNADAIIRDVQEVVELQSIDPIHAAGGCYCRECKHHNKTACPAYDAPFNRTSLRIEYCNCGERRESNDTSIL